MYEERGVTSTVVLAVILTTMRSAVGRSSRGRQVAVPDCPAIILRGSGDEECYPVPTPFCTHFPLMNPHHVNPNRRYSTINFSSIITIPYVVCMFAAEACAFETPRRQLPSSYFGRQATLDRFYEETFIRSQRCSSEATPKTRTTSSGSSICVGRARRAWGHPGPG